MSDIYLDAVATWHFYLNQEFTWQADVWTLLLLNFYDDSLVQILLYEFNTKEVNEQNKQNDIDQDMTKNFNLSHLKYDIEKQLN